MKVGRGTKPTRSNTHTRARPAYVAGDSPLNLGGGAACASDPEPARRVHTRDGFRFVVHPTRSRTPGISREAVPAPDLAGAGMRRHVHSGNHAAESFVSFIPLFDGVRGPSTSTHSRKSSRILLCSEAPRMGTRVVARPSRSRRGCARTDTG